MTRINVIPPEKLTRPPLPLAELVDLASPFKAHRGGTCPHLRITQAGMEELEASPPSER